MLGLGLILGGCGLNVTSADLFALTRTGQGRQLVVVVNDGGTIRCDGGSAKPIPDSLLLDARSLATSLVQDAKAGLRLPAAASTAYRYTVRLQDGTVTFPDTATARHPELAQAELFALHAARAPCGGSG